MAVSCKNRFFGMARIVVLNLLVALFFMSCSGEVKADEKFVETFVELRLLEFAYGVDSPTIRLARQGVLNRYGYTREEYLAKIDKVLDDENQWVPFQKAVNERLETLLAIPKKNEGDAPSKKKGPPKTRKGNPED